MVMTTTPPQAVKYLERMLVQANSQVEQQVEVEVKPHFQATADTDDVEMTPVDADNRAEPTANCSRPVDPSIVKQEPIGEDNVELSAIAAAAASDASGTNTDTGTVSAEAQRPAPADADIKMEVDDGDSSSAAADEQKTPDNITSNATDDQKTDAVQKPAVEDSATTATATSAAAEVVTSASCSKGINIDPRTYCKLGHFHLLLEDYPKGSCGRCDTANFGF